MVSAVFQRDYAIAGSRNHHLLYADHLELL